MRTAHTIEIKRHFQKMSEKETEELVGAVADVLVTFIKNRKDERRENDPADRLETEAKRTGR